MEAIERMLRQITLHKITRIFRHDKLLREVYTKLKHYLGAFACFVKKKERNMKALSIGHKVVNQHSKQQKKNLWSNRILVHTLRSKASLNSCM